MDTWTTSPTYQSPKDATSEAAAAADSQEQLKDKLAEQFVQPIQPQAGTKISEPAASSVAASPAETLPAAPAEPASLIPPPPDGMPEREPPTEAEADQCLEDHATQEVARAKEEAERARVAAIMATIPAPLSPELAPVQVKDLTPLQARLARLESKLHPVRDHFGVNEAGNARRFAVEYEDVLRYCHEEKRWYIWKSNRWGPDYTGRVITYARQLLTRLSGVIMNMPHEDYIPTEGEPAGKKIPRAIFTEANWTSPMTGQPLTKLKPNKMERLEFTMKMATLVKFFANEQCKRGLTNMVALAQDEMAISAADFDPEIWAFNVRNGTIDLKADRGAGEIYPHDPEMLITKLAPVMYTVAGETNEEPNPDATMPIMPGTPPPSPTITVTTPPACFPAFDNFLEETCAGKLVTEHGTYAKGKALERFIQKAFGLAMTGHTREKKMFLAHGDTDTGKSTLIEAVMRVMGDYAAHAPFEAFIQKRDSGGPSPDIAKLVGKRMVVCEEVDISKKLSAGTIKGLVSGGSMLTARGLYQSPITFIPKCKLWLVTNHRPRIDATDGAMWSRIHVIPLNNRVPKEKQDKTLRDQFATPEAQARILAWLVEGVLLYQQEGLIPPECVTAAQVEYKDTQDLLAEFLNDCCKVADDACVEYKTLYSTYDQWCQDNHEKNQLGRKRFAQELASRGFRAYRTGTFRGRAGLSLLPCATRRAQ